MLDFIEKLVTSLWNRTQGRHSVKADGHGVTLGFQVVEEAVTERRITLSETRRTMHLVILGKTGSGKSACLRLIAEQDIRAGRGFFFIDQHGDAAPFRSAANSLGGNAFYYSDGCGYSADRADAWNWNLRDHRQLQL